MKEKIKICAISDLHGRIEKLDIPPCDLLLIAGDIAPDKGRNLHSQANWYRFKFRNWLNRQPAKEVVAVPGNHDYICDSAERGLLYRHSLPCHLIWDECVEVFGYKIWCSPWSLHFSQGYVFNIDEDGLYKHIRHCPEDVDIILSHSPPKGILDVSAGENVGSGSVLNRIYEVQPLLVVCGHIHCQYGLSQAGDSLVINGSVVDSHNKLAKEPIVLEFSPEGYKIEQIAEIHLDERYKPDAYENE